MNTARSIGLVALVSFLSFVILNVNKESDWGPMAIIWLLSSLIIVVLLGRKVLPHWISKKGKRKGIIIGGLVILVLIPLVLMGTCAVNAGGAALSGLFHR